MKKSIFNAAFIGLIITTYSHNLHAQTGQVHIEQDKDIEKLLEFKKDFKSDDTFKIQVYNGNRNGAESVKSQASSMYNNWPVTMEYETPNYKVWVGNFRSRLEADRALIKVKKHFNVAFIFNPKN